MNNRSSALLLTKAARRLNGAQAPQRPKFRTKYRHLARKMLHAARGPFHLYELCSTWFTSGYEIDQQTELLLCEESVHAAAICYCCCTPSTACSRQSLCIMWKRIYWTSISWPARAWERRFQNARKSSFTRAKCKLVLCCEGVFCAQASPFSAAVTQGAAAAAAAARACIVLAIPTRRNDTDLSAIFFTSPSLSLAVAFLSREYRVSIKSLEVMSVCESCLIWLRWHFPVQLTFCLSKHALYGW